MTYEQPAEPLGHAVAANVSQLTVHGAGGAEVRHGLRHFAAGAKVWICAPRWHPLGDVVVAGRHRGSNRRYVTVVTKVRFLETFRATAVHSPALHRALTRPLPGQSTTPGLWSREEAEEYAAYHNDCPLQFRTDAPSLLHGFVPVPPPAELTLHGEAYRLTRVNAHQARYSPTARTVPTPPEGTPA
ncbi:hypothetical protein [Kitasatospora sp. NPDC101183]|uniref:hypothetical protein n=1 Tax=Kitasatospora sp. NPDC101183 TaxID=3364100 RepID=UPI00380C00CE